MATVMATAATAGTTSQMLSTCSSSRPAAAAVRGCVLSFEGLRGVQQQVPPVLRLLRSQNGSNGFRSRKCGGVVSVRAATATAAPKFTTFKPLGDRVLVKLQKLDEKTTGGILLPTSAQSKPQGGEVVEVGEGKAIGDKKIEVGVSKGDSIVYSKFAGTEVEFNGENFMLLKEDDIMGRLKGDDIKDLKPINDRVLIKVAEAEQKSSGGVLLTDSAKEKPSIGDIIAAGSGTVGEDGQTKPLELKEGNTVLYSKYAGNEFKGKDGSSFVVLRAADVLAVLS